MEAVSETKCIPNSEIFKEFVDRYLGKKAGDFRDCLSPNLEVEYVGPSLLPMKGVHKGIAEFNRVIEMIQSYVEVKEYIIEKTIVEGNEVATTGYTICTSRKTGITGPIYWGEFLTIENGLIAKWRIVLDSYLVLQMFGLVPAEAG